MNKRTMDEMISYFNQEVSKMDISQENKLKLLGMITAIGTEGGKTMENNIKTFDFILKSGAVITVTCEHCELKYVGNELTKYRLEGIHLESDLPLYIRIDDISAVVQRGKR